MKYKLLLAASLLSIFFAVGFIFTNRAEAAHGTCIPNLFFSTPAQGGSLATNDCRSHSRGANYYADYYKFSGIAGSVVRIEITNHASSAALYLLNSSNTVLASDSCCSDIIISNFILPANGDYQIEVTSQAPDQAFNYTLNTSGITPLIGIAPENPTNPVSLGYGLYGLVGTYNGSAQNDSNIAFSTDGHPGSRSFPFGFTGSSPVPFSVTWEGYIIPQYSQNYTFYVSRDDDADLWVNGVKIISKGAGSSVGETSGSIALVANVAYPIKLDFIQQYASVARAVLYWSSSSQPKQIVPGFVANPTLDPDQPPSVSSIYLTAGSNPLVPDVWGGPSDSYSGSTQPGTTKTQTIWANYLGADPSSPVFFSADSVPDGVTVTFSPASCTPRSIVNTTNNYCSVQMNMAVPANAAIDTKYTITVTAQRGSVPEAAMAYVLEVAPAFVSCGSSHCATFISQSVPTNMTPGSIYDVSVTMQNNGTAIWTSLEGFRLGSQNPQDSQTWGTGRVELPIPAILPGESATFKFNVTAPSTPGTYNFQWRMVDDGCCWFGEYSPNVSVNVSGTPTIPPTPPLGSGPRFFLLFDDNVATKDVNPGASVDVGIEAWRIFVAQSPVTFSGFDSLGQVGVSFNPASCLPANTLCTIMRLTVPANATPGPHIITIIASDPLSATNTATLVYTLTVGLNPIIQQILAEITKIEKQINDILAGTYVPNLFYPVSPFYLTDFDNNYIVEGTGTFPKKVIVNLGFGGYLQGVFPKVTLSSGGTTPASGITASFTYPDSVVDSDTSCDYYDSYTTQGQTGVTGLECLSNALISIPSNTPAGQYVLTINGVGEATVAVVGGTPIADPSSRSSMVYVINVGTQPCPAGTTGPGVPNCTPDPCPPGTVGSAGVCVVPPSVFTHVLTDPNNTYAVNMSAGTTNTSGQIKVTSTAGTIGASFKEVSFTTTAITKVGALTATGLTASAEPCSVSGGSPTCLSTITITAPSNATGQYIVTFTSSAENALVPGTISYTVTVNPIQPCPSGTTGTFPNCNVPCPAGTTGGTFPNCAPNPITCPPGTVGVVPNCTVPCPSGTTGTNLPNCVVPCPAGSTGTSVPNCTIVPPPSSFSISLNPPAATVSKAAYVGLGSAGSTSVSSNPSLVSQVNITGSPVIVLYEDPLISRADGQSVGGPTKIFARVNPGGCTQEGQVIVDPRAQGCLSVFLVNPDASASGVTYYIDVKAVNEQQRPATARFTLTVKP